MITRMLGAMVVGLGVLLCAQALRAEPTTSSSATTQSGPMAITVTGVVGNVQVREGSDKHWQKAVVGMAVTEGAEFRTGPRSAIRRAGRAEIPILGRGG